MTVEEMIKALGSCQPQQQVLVYIGGNLCVVTDVVGQMTPDDFKGGVAATLILTDAE